MEKDNLWPSINDVEETNSISSFICKLESELTNQFSGKIKSKFILVEFEESPAEIMESTIRRIPFNQSKEKSDEIETGRNAVNTKKTKRYKFMIFSDSYFFRVFDIDMGDFFPVFYYPFGDENKCSTVDSELDLEQRIQITIKSSAVKNAICFILKKQ